MSSELTGAVDGLFRHPVKGFTPEPLDAVTLTAGACFPGDRLFAVENGPSGFDPDAPKHVSKSKFTVLARLPQIAAVRTRYDEAAGTLAASHAEHGSIEADLGAEEGRAAFAAWLDPIVGDGRRGALKVLTAPGAHRFMDDTNGFVSIINLASVRDVAEKVGRPVDPARFRGNIYVEGWPAWREQDADGASFKIGGATVSVIQRIRRCAATHVDPQTAVADLDVVAALREHYGHFECGLYVRVVEGGRVATGDPITEA